MTSTKQTEFFSLRKARLQSQIFQALKQHNDQVHSVLKAQWVHRYGLETLHELEISNEKLLFTESSQLIAGNETFQPNNVKQEVELCQPPVEDEIIQPNNVKQEVELCQPPVEDEIIQPNNELCIEEIFQDEFNQLSDDGVFISTSAEETEKSLIESSNVVAPPPPPPSISHLRRWLPSVRGDEAKAS